MWSTCLPGETLTACAAREVAEEAGLRLRGGEAATTRCAYDRAEQDEGAAAGAEPLRLPVPFAAVDVVSRDSCGAIEYHYAIVEVRLRSRAGCGREAYMQRK